ncbi:short chain dehydrogenase [Fusarium proliferatum]|nr:short chain dehydrogenase [Fusarium proliferatum]
MAGKVIVVTGAGNGIGLAVVKKLLQSPTVSHVVAVDLKTDKLESIQGDYAQKLHIFAGDVCQENTNIQAVEMAIRHGGRLTTLILNAATFRPLGAFPTLSLESWKHTFNINFFANIHMLQVAWQHLQESSGSVIVTSSRAVLNYLCGCIPLEDSRISAIAITPGAVDTEMQTGLREEGTVSPELQKFLNALKAEGRLLKPEEPAGAFAKLVETGIPKDLNGQTVYWEDVL